MPLKDSPWHKERLTSAAGITKYPTAQGSARPSPALAFCVWGHLWRLGPWAGVAVMTYSTNPRGYSIPRSLQPYRLWCHILLWHLTAFHGEARRDWIVLFAPHLCVCQAGLIACWLQFQSGWVFFIIITIYFISHHENFCQSDEMQSTTMHHQIKA